MKIKDHDFKPFITAEQIRQAVQTVAGRINADYKKKEPLFIPVLNGSFIFAGDLLRQINGSCQVSFVKASSYNGMASSGQLKTLIGIEESLFNRDIIIVEDIVDTGLTLQRMLDELGSLGARSVEVATLLRKRTAREKGIQVKYVGLELEDEFVVGYGLDYEGLGRNLTDLYKAHPRA
ncbi:MAG: hypoxanthine phosphoribosyltransferase [Cyclobacteriaceae bacterium]|nr:hypoxanthine phosphoribosyltransferase [Cyclobacteriaceae bacterium]